MEPSTSQNGAEDGTANKMNKYRIVTLVFGLTHGLEFLLLIFCLASNDWLKGSLTGDGRDNGLVSYTLWERKSSQISICKVIHL